MDSHSGRTAVIIGASSGIGEALARELNRDGWRLALARAARQIMRAVRRRTTHAYITRRYALVAVMFKLWPR